jgi:hypothetical protein
VGLEAMKLKYSMEIHFSSLVLKLEILAELPTQLISVILEIPLQWEEVME